MIMTRILIRMHQSLMAPIHIPTRMEVIRIQIATDLVHTPIVTEVTPTRIVIRQNLIRILMAVVRTRAHTKVDHTQTATDQTLIRAVMSLIHMEVIHIRTLMKAIRMVVVTRNKNFSIFGYSYILF